jgi:hypothetical protein
MRRFTLIAALLLSFALPGAAQAGTCPVGVPEGVVDKDVYRLGEVVDIYGSYLDYANPGTVTLTFLRPSDGATREFTAANVADGSWFWNTTFDSAADAGHWNVTVVVDQDGGHDVCTDSFIVRASSSPPPTDTRIDDTVSARSSSDIRLPLVLGGLSFVLVILRRRRPGSPI